MPRITVKDMDKEKKLTKKEMKGVTGGKASTCKTCAPCPGMKSGKSKSKSSSKSKTK